jgi:hypothetical protein
VFRSAQIRRICAKCEGGLQFLQVSRWGYELGFFCFVFIDSAGSFSSWDTGCILGKNHPENGKRDGEKAPKNQTSCGLT